MEKETTQEESAEKIGKIMQMEKKGKEGTQQEETFRINNKTLPSSVRGGDINACLSSIEIDKFCQPHIQSDLFFRLRNGEVDTNTVRRTITNARQATGDDTRVRLICHGRHIFASSRPHSPNRSVLPRHPARHPAPHWEH
jgi:hypothetical protein